MNVRFLPQVMFAALAGAIASPAFADVLYKLVDKNGKVTYSEEKPKNFDGQVIVLDINPKANTATLPKGADANLGGTSSRPGSEGKSPRSDAETRLAEARDRVERAQRALQEARDHPADGDIRILGNKGGGVRMIPTDEYQKKLDALEQEVKNAQEDLRRAQRDG
ncbi:MAG TPA: DUF4124 domain-containing protein [Usitatibacter sp.]